MSSATRTSLGAALATIRDEGRPLLIAYLMAGSTPGWLDVAEQIVLGGADALEIGLPFSDPIIDGPVIQEAATRSIAAGTTMHSALDELATRRLDVPLIAMTYCNVVLRHGYAAAAEQLVAAGVVGAIVPDLPLEELDAWQRPANESGLETVLLAAPATPPARLDEICARSQGFVYAVGRMATTGESTRVDPKGIELVASLRGRTPLPVCLGIGVSTPAQAAEVCAVADGVIVGSAVVRRMLEGQRPDEVGRFVAGLREAIG